MPKYKIIKLPNRKRWGEGWGVGDVVSIDTVAAQAGVENGELQYISDDEWMSDKIQEKFKDYTMLDLKDENMLAEAIRIGSSAITEDREFQTHILDIIREARKPLVDDSERVEVIVLTIKNDRDITGQCINGLLRSEYPFKITIYENSLNTMNTSKIWNKLIRESKCGYVMLIDSDAFPQNDILTPMVDVLKRHPEAAAVGSVGGESFVPDIQRIPLSDSEEFVHPGHLSGYCLMFNKKVFDEGYWFDEDFLFYGQDSDWAQRINESKKWKLFVTPKAWAYHGTKFGGSLSSERPGGFKRFNKFFDTTYARTLYRLKRLVREHGENGQG